MVKGSEELEDGYIAMYCGMHAGGTCVTSLRH